MTDVGPPAPATSLWDINDVTDRALTVLRLHSGDVDEPRVGDAALVATGAVDSFVDAAEPFAPSAAMVDAAVQVTVELYRRKDAPFGTANAWSTDTVPVPVGADSLHGVLMQLLPDKERWGVA